MEKGLGAFVIRCPFWPSGRVANEIERARISMMARSSQAGPDSAKPTFQIITFGMQRAAAPCRWGHEQTC